jgi:outer membrane protein TolC
MENRMELLEIELLLARDAAAVDIERNSTLPYLDLTYGFSANGAGSTAGDSYTRVRGKNFETHSVGLAFEIPVGNAAARSRLRRAVYDRIQRLATREERRLLIKREVLDAVDEIEAGWQRLMANRQRTILAGRNLEAEQRQFELGSRTSTEVLEAQTRLANAQSDEVSALADYEIAVISLARATGTLVGAAGVQWQSAAEIEAEMSVDSR